MVDDVLAVQLIPESPSPVPLRDYLRRAVQRPRAWALAYLLTTIPALALALLTGLAILPLTRYPALRYALEARSLDLLTDLASLDVQGGGFAVVGMIALLLVLPVAIVIKLVWVWLEGGTLADYAAPTTLSWHAFRQAGRRWFAVLLVLNLIGTAMLLVIGGATLLPALLVYTRFPTLAWGIGAVGLVVAGLWATWIEMARAVAVVYDERHALHALKRAAHTLVRQWRPLFLLIGGSLLLFGVLFLLHRWSIRRLPLDWWLPTLAIQQVYTMLRLGIRLTRQAGQVGVCR
ncbi:MAG TPA: hypothetical protein PLJ78_09415 [Anaerolineae bacterium]|nr:hypothetical protein [Anaerolineae bacterium]HQK14146.1 hypothetical protein [Anaerolineae bacterium]